MNASPAITIHWTPALVDQLRAILRQHRVAPQREDVSTPELMQLALADEHCLELHTLKRLARALAGSQGTLLDHDVIAALQRFAERSRSAAASAETSATRMSTAPATPLSGTLPGQGPQRGRSDLPLNPMNQQKTKRTHFAQDE